MTIDAAGAIIDIRASVGGEDAAHLAELLLLMYARYVERRGLTFEINSLEEHEISGHLRSASIASGGPVYGLLKYEHGTHHIKRANPFWDNRIVSSTAIVEVWPDIQAKVNIEDLEISTFLVGCPPVGGYEPQHWKYASVRLKHLPSGATVECGSELTTEANKARALRTMAIRLAMGEDRPPAYKTKVRSYVVDGATTFVKDYRTGWRGNDPQAVLDGGLDLITEPA